MQHTEFKALVDEFVSLVTLGRSLDAMARFYADDATAQENLRPKHSGKKACEGQERIALETLSEPPRAQAKAVALDLERGIAIIHWRIIERTKTGIEVGLDKVAIQHWRDGTIRSERFIFERPMNLSRREDHDAFGQ